MNDRKRGLDDETKRELEQAAKEAEEKKAQRRREERRAGTKYGVMLSDGNDE